MLFVIVYLSLPLPLIQDSLTKVALFLVGIFVLIVLSRALKVLFLEVLPSSTRDKHLVDQIYPLLRRLSVTIVWII